jgi:hypothetical protein
LFYHCAFGSEHVFKPTRYNNWIAIPAHSVIGLHNFSIFGEERLGNDSFEVIVFLDGLWNFLGLKEVVRYGFADGVAIGNNVRGGF